MRSTDILRDILQADKISKFDYELFRDACFKQGISDEKGLLLGLIPHDYSDWRAHVAERRKLYTEYLADFSREHLETTTVEQIDKDVRRTLPSLAFFRKAVEETPDTRLNISGDCANHSEVIQRILYLYAKLNPGVGYVQGMNELLAPLYFVMATNEDAGERRYAEPDAFWLFFSLISDMKDLYLRSMDTDKTHGISASLDFLMQLLKKHDQELWADLESKGIHPAYYAFRWLSVLLAREFELPDLIRIWDSVFSDSKRFLYLNSFCVSMLTSIRDQLLQSDYSEVIQTLQNYPAKDVDALLKRAYEIYEDYALIKAKQQPMTPLSSIGSAFNAFLQQIDIKTKSPHKQQQP